MCTSRSKIKEYINLITDRNALSGALKGLEKKSFCMPLLSILEVGANFYTYTLYNLWKLFVPIIEKSDSLFYSILSILKGNYISLKS